MQTIINSRDRSRTTPHVPTCGLPRSPEQSREEETKKMKTGNMSKVVDGKRYSTETATVIASNDYFDGYNYERNGRNCFLMRTPHGRYFKVNMSRWQDELNKLVPIDEDEAIKLYERLSEYTCEYEDAFPNQKVEEA